MFIYFFLLLIIYLIALIEPKKINTLDIVFFVLLALISGLRYDVGTDYFSYVNSHELIKMGNSLNIEPGFKLLSSIISLLGLNSQALFLILSTLTMFFIYKGIKYYADSDYIYKPVLYIILLIFVFFPSMNVVRQILAASIMFFASKYIIEKRFVRFLIFVLVSMSFHYSSFIFIGLYFIVTKEYKKRTLFIGLIVTLFIVRFDAITTMFEYIIYNMSFFDVGGYISTYLNYAYNNREIDYGITFIVNIFVLIIFILLKDRLIKNKKHNISFNFFYLFIMFNILTIAAPVLSRLTYYFAIYMAVSISKFCIMFDDKSKKVIQYLLLTLYSILYLYTIINGYFNPEEVDFIPYDLNLNFLK